MKRRLTEILEQAKADAMRREVARIRENLARRRLLGNQWAQDALARLEAGKSPWEGL